MALKARNRLNGQRLKRDPPAKKLPVRVELANGLGLSNEDLRPLIANWIVPQLIGAFIAETKRQAQSNAADISAHFSNANCERDGPAVIGDPHDQQTKASQELHTKDSI